MFKHIITCSQSHHKCNSINHVCLKYISNLKKYLEYHAVYAENVTDLGIDVCMNALSTKNRLLSQRTTTPYKNKINNCKLINLVISIELARAILMPRFSNFLRNSINHFRMFLNMETCFLRVTISLLCRLQAVSKIHIPIFPL